MMHQLIKKLTGFLVCKRYQIVSGSILNIVASEPLYHYYYFPKLKITVPVQKKKGM